MLLSKHTKYVTIYNHIVFMTPSDSSYAKLIDDIEIFVFNSSKKFNTNILLDRCDMLKTKYCKNPKLYMSNVRDKLREKENYYHYWVMLIMLNHFLAIGKVNRQKMFGLFIHVMKY